MTLIGIGSIMMCNRNESKHTVYIWHSSVNKTKTIHASQWLYATCKITSHILQSLKNNNKEKWPHNMTKLSLSDNKRTCTCISLHALFNSKQRQRLIQNLRYCTEGTQQRCSNAPLLQDVFLSWSNAQSWKAYVLVLYWLRMQTPLNHGLIVNMVLNVHRNHKVY